MLPWGKQGDGAEGCLQRPWGHAPPHQHAWILLQGPQGGNRGKGRAVASSERLCLPPLKWLLATILSSQLRAGVQGEQVVSWA